MNIGKPNSGRAVWARRSVFSIQCPKSTITSRSIGFLELHRTWKQLGGVDVLSLDAKSAEALMVLEEAWKEEVQYGEIEK